MQFGRVIGATLAAVLAIVGSARAAGPDIPGDLVTVRLIAETPAAVPGATIWVAAHFEVKPGWHI